MTKHFWELTEEQKQRAREARRRWYQRNKSKRAKYMKEWFAENKGYHREWRKKNHAKRVEQDRKQRIRDKEKIAKRMKVYMAKNKEKARAWWQVKEAIRQGAIKRRPCEVCGKKHSHAHHDDYSKPLDVIWLCPAHHSERHIGG
jgi:DNA repair exonuclease SbcCD ATPase subunit